MNHHQILELVEPLLHTEFKYRDWQEFATEYNFDSSESAYDQFCAWLDLQEATE